MFGGIGLLYLLAVLFGGIAPLLALLWAAVAFVGAFAIDAAVAALVRLIPAHRFRPEQGIFRVSPRECRLLVRLGIRRWKDRIPETGGLLCNFSKKTVADRTDPAYLTQFIAETCYAELMHLLSIPLGFLVLLFALLWGSKYLFFFALPVAAVNAVLQLLPVLVQRYVRPYLLRARAHLLKKKEKDPA